MPFPRLRFPSALPAYEEQAQRLFAAWRAGEADAIALFRHHHPRFLDERIPWLPKRIPESDIRDAPLDGADARLALARWYSFQDWERLAEWADAVARDGSPTAIFETAVEAVIDGDLAALERSLARHPELPGSRSTLVTNHDPPVHGATLLHYLAANGVEDWRQRSPGNAVEVAERLLAAGAEVDALAGMYGGQCTTMSLLVSSSPPAEAGVQVPLVETLLDHGASVEPRGAGAWTSPLLTALAFGFAGAAEALTRRGARVDTVAAAAGLGRLAEARALLAGAGAEDRHRALALAAQQGHVDIVRLLLDAGEDPDRYNPKGNHAHSTPLHQAVWAGHETVVRLLVERGARLDIRDTVHQGTPLAWAEYGGRKSIAEYLRSRDVPR